MGYKTSLGVDAVICCAHRARPGAPIHGHTYEVTAWREADGRDQQDLQTMLRGACEAYDHRLLPMKLSRAEDLGLALLEFLGPDWTEIELRRPAEGLRVRITR